MAMAVFADIVELRLRIKDPLGVIAIVSVADEAARHAVTTLARQTAYLQADTGVYYVYDGDTAAWEAQDLLLSDTRIGTLIDLYGVLGAASRCVKDIMAELGQRLYIARTADGAGSTDYASIRDMYQFYKDLAASMIEEGAVDAGVSTGRYLRMRRPRIGGGMCG
jgi:hypothetical protein